jgi:hypothetical protein
MLVQEIETRFKQIIMQVCQEHQAEIEELEVLPDHVQRHGQCRSAIGHSSIGQADQGAFIPLLASGISGAQAKIADAIDQLLLCGNNWRCSVDAHRAVH